MNMPAHFKAEDFHSHKSPLPNEVLAVVMDSFVVCAVDCLVINHQGKILLAKRAFEPQANNWWLIGDLMEPGEIFAATAQRILREKLGLEIVDAKRFKFLNCHSYVWDRRRQPLQENGCHVLMMTMAVIITVDELPSVSLKIDEYSELRWHQAEAAVICGGYHPAVRICVRDFLLSVQKIGT